MLHLYFTWARASPIGHKPCLPSTVGWQLLLTGSAQTRCAPEIRRGPQADTSSTVLVLFNHYLCFTHFSSLPAARSYGIYTPPSTEVPTFTEIASYFGLCVWLVPFALFVSLSASDNVLPTMGSEAASGATGGVPGIDDGGKGRPKGHSLIKAVIDGFQNWVGDAGNVLGWWKSDRNNGGYL